MTTESDALDAYEDLAETFARQVDTKAHNAYYDRPALLSLMPAVAGLCVLDAGCGPGVYSEWLAEHGANVAALDGSAKMVALARRRLGRRADVRQHDLTRPLVGLADGTFDGVLSALVLGHLRNWSVPLGEFRRVLKPGGWLVFSVEHPFDLFYDQPQATRYFDTERITFTVRWPGLAHPIDIPVYRRPLQAMIGPLLGAGFALEAVLEPTPTRDFQRAEPYEYAKLMRQPGFICFRAHRTN